MGFKNIIERIISILITILVGVGIISQPMDAPILSAETATPSITAAPLTIAKTPIPTLTLDPQAGRPEPGSVCGFDPMVAELIEGLAQSDWANWIEILSGEKPVTVNGESFSIETRYNESMFNGSSNARAYDFVIDQLRQWGYRDNVDLFEQAFFPTIKNSSTKWKNIIVVIPGKDLELAQDQILLTAHLDSTSQGDPEVRAPGADDNASGAATLMEAARILKGHHFERTIKIIFFTGEEQGLHGSRAYVNQYWKELSQIVGVFNLDMFGYDADNDRCFEMHVGWLKDSNTIGGCLADTIEIYDSDLKFDYLTTDARGSSDHVTFWDKGVGAIEVLENFDTHNYENGCGESDINPHYHTDQDLIAGMNLETGHAIAKAAIAAVARLANPMKE